MKTLGGDLRLVGVQKNYGGFAVDVSMEVPHGSLVSLLGPSGSGKTSTLRLIAGFETADAGKILLGDRDISWEQPRDRRFGFVPQDLVLFPHLDVAANVAYGLRARGVAKKVAAEKARELIEVVGLAGFGSRRIDKLSGGERQRVALARALAIDPAVLLLDEPFSALDTPLRREMRTEVLRIKRRLGISVIFVTHNQEEALSISDHIVLMHNGSVMQSGTPESLYRRPASRFAAEFIGAANTIPVIVEGVRGNTVSLGGAVHLQVELDTEDSARSERILLVRPDSFSFVNKGGTNTIAAVINDRRFLGDRYEYECGTDVGPLTVVVTERREFAANVLLSFDPADGYLVPEDGQR